MKQTIQFLVFTILMVAAGVANAQTTLTFQNGVDGYTGLLEVYTGLSGATGGPDANVLGSDVTDVFMDGVYNTGDDIQGLLRFDGLVEAIPAGAQILNATLEFTTSEVANSPSGGPYGVSQLFVPFDENTTYNGAVEGFRFADGETSRPLPNGFVNLAAGGLGTADVTQIVQAWVDGEPNDGFVITAGTTNGWSVLTSGFLDEPMVRPRLIVDFTTDAPQKTEMGMAQQSADDASTTMFIVEVFNDLFINADNIGSGNDFLDGGGSDTQALVRFDSIFMSEGGFVPDDAQIVKAELCMTTTDSNFSTNSGTGGEYGVREILNDWDGTGSFSDLSFGAFVDGEFGLIADAIATFDVTTVIQGYQDGNPNFGFNVASTGTTDGWGIRVSTTTEAPQLKVFWIQGDGDCPSGFERGDVNQDGSIDLLDVTPFVDAISAGSTQCEADVNGDGSVDLLDVGPFVALLTGG